MAVEPSIFAPEFDLLPILQEMGVQTAAAHAAALVPEEWLRRSLSGADNASVSDLGVRTFPMGRRLTPWPARGIRAHRPALGVGYPERTVDVWLTQNERGRWIVMR